MLWILNKPNQWRKTPKTAPSLGIRHPAGRGRAMVIDSMHNVVVGRLFHTFGPTTKKLLSLSRVLDRGTVRALTSAECRQRWLESSDKLAVVREVRFDFVTQRLENNNGQFEDDPLLHWQPVEAWYKCWNVVTLPGARQKARRRVLDQLQMPEQGVRDTAKQCITVVEATRYERLDWTSKPLTHDRKRQLAI